MLSNSAVRSLLTVSQIFSTLLVLSLLLEYVCSSNPFSPSGHNGALSTRLTQEDTAPPRFSSNVNGDAHITSYSYRAHHSKRGISAEEFNAYVCKGERYLDTILHGQPLKHHWGPEDLQNGWTDRTHQDVIEYQGPEDLAPIMEQLGIPHSDIDIHRQQWYQDRPFMDSSGHANTVSHILLGFKKSSFLWHYPSLLQRRSGSFRPLPISLHYCKDTLTSARFQPATGGHYHNDFIPNGNTIISESNYSPRFKVGPNAEVPPLWRWSDIIWLLWTGEKGEEEAHQLRYIFHTAITTNTTRHVMEYIGGVQQDRLSLLWPGRGFNMSSREGRALLATPHGAGITYLIADHSDVLGRKVPYARIFTMDLTESDSDSEVGSGSKGEVESEPDHYYISWEIRNATSGSPLL